MASTKTRMYPRNNEAPVAIFRLVGPLGFLKQLKPVAIRIDHDNPDELTDTNMDPGCLRWRGLGSLGLFSQILGLFRDSETWIKQVLPKRRTCDGFV